jgi:two-component system NtrC family sensor kinase
VGPKPPARFANLELRKANRELHEAKWKLKETQAQLIQYQKMALLGQLVAEVAHEIQNPLAFVANNLFLIESRLDGLDSEMQSRLSKASFKTMGKARTWLGEMREGLNRIDKLVLGLRTLSPLDEGEFKTVDVCDSIDSVLLMLRHQIDNRINVKKLYGSARTLHCYAGRLNQLLMNLIANAVAAIVEKGNLVITTSQTAELFLISVRDTGAGIPESIRSKIFEPFFSTKPFGQGTGLGLAISHGIVKDHGGSIEVQSEEGVGTEFMVRIPLNLEVRRSPHNGLMEKVASCPVHAIR